MNREITSKEWVWFIRAWLTIPIAILIPHFIAFFYPDRPSEQHIGFWLIVCLCEILYYVCFVKSVGMRRLMLPTLGTIAVPLALILVVLPTLRYHDSWSVADNLSNRFESLLEILAFIPLMFVYHEGAKKARPTPIP